MNVQRFTGRNSREAMQKLRQALGDDAVVLSTKPCAEGIEILAMTQGTLAAVEQHPDVRAARAHQSQPQQQPQQAQQAAAKPATAMAKAASAISEVAEDVAKLGMSTLSFQDYVRNRMLKKREAQRQADAEVAAAAERAANKPTVAQPAAAQAVRQAMQDELPSRFEISGPMPLEHSVAAAALPAGTAHAPVPAAAPQRRREVPPTQRAAAITPIPTPAELAARDPQSDAAMMNELRSMKGLIEERFGALAFMEKLQRQPQQAKLTQKLLACGFSPVLIRKLVEGLTPDVADEQAWAAGVLERNLQTGEREAAIEDQGGVFAMIGATGVGKTTSTAKLAAAFATRHGASNLGLITLDAYRLGAHEQLRAYGRILGVPVHTAHDRTALEDLLDLLSAKKMVLIDTAGVAQRDSRTRELLDMLAHPAINKLLVVNTAVQGETIDDVMISYRAAACKGVVLSKLDEAVKLAPALDAVIRHKQKVVAVANGQRVPEDWHRLSGQALVHRALRAGGSPAYHYDASEMNLVFAAPQQQARERQGVRA